MKETFFIDTLMHKMKALTEILGYFNGTPSFSQKMF